MSDMTTPERRRERRRPVLKVARIVSDTRPMVSCVVHNMSAHGGKLALEPGAGVPDQFVLDIFGEPPRDARVIWRSVSEVGVVLI